MADYDPTRNPENHPYSEYNPGSRTALDPALRKAAEDARKGGLFGGSPDVTLIIDMIEQITGLDLSLLEDIIGGIQRTLNQIGDIFNNVVVTPINNVVSSVKDWFLGLIGFRSNVGEQLDNQFVEIENQGTFISALEGSLQEKASFYDIPSMQPLWMSTNPLEDVSLPRVLLDNHTKKVNLWGQGNGRSRNPNMLNINGTPDLAHTYEPFFSAIENHVEVAYLRVSFDRIYNQVSFIIGPGSTAIPATYAVVGKMLTSGALQPLFKSENLGPLMSLAKHQFVLQMNKDLQARQGEIWFVALFQTGVIASALRPYAGVEMHDIAAPPLVFPNKMSSQIQLQFNQPSQGWTYQNGGVFIVEGNMPRDRQLFTDNWVPWVSLGTSVNTGPPPALTWTDNFDRPNQIGYGSNWALIGSGQGIEGGTAAIQGGSDGLRMAQWAFPLNYDDVQVEGRAVGTNSSGAPTTLFCRMGQSRSRGVGFQFNSNRVELYSFNSTYPNGVVSRASASVSVPNGSLLRVSAIDNIYTAYVNDVPVLQWVDANLVMPQGKANRFWGFGISRTFPGINSAAWDWVRAYDMARQKTA